MMRKILTPAMKRYFLIGLILLAGGLALFISPEGLSRHAWTYTCMFIVAMIVLASDLLPGPMVGLVAVSVIALFSSKTLFSPEQIRDPAFNVSEETFRWAVSGFTNSTVWLIFGAFMIAKAYEKTGLGRRIALAMVKHLGKRTLTLGYAVMLADLLLAPVMPSNTARSGGVVYPIIGNLPALYGSAPGKTAHKAGSFLTWTAVASTCVTSSLFMSALAPNVLAVGMVKDATGLTIDWGSWFLAMLPVGVLLLLLVPILTYWIYPPTVRENPKVQQWASSELTSMKRLTRHEILVIIIVAGSLLGWIFGSAVADPAIVALVAISLLLLSGVLKWEDVAGNRAAWSTFVWFATLITLAGGLQKVGFISWLGEKGKFLDALNPHLAVILILVFFFLSHYLFASTTAHTTALLPLMLPILAGIPGVNLFAACLFLVSSLGLMGIITPYGTGPSPIWYGSGFVTTKEWWRLGAIFGAIFLVALIALGYPWMLLIL